MKIKKEYVILAAVIVALSAYLLTRQTDRSQYTLPEIPTVSAQKITRLEIGAPDRTIDLRREDDRWHIQPQEYPAASGKIRQMLEPLENLTLTALVSESENYSRYELDSENKITVKAWAGDALVRELAIGKAAPSFRHTFVSLPGDPRVFHARGNFRNAFEAGADQLRDKTVLKFAASDIHTIRLAGSADSLTLVRSEVPIESRNGAEDETPQSVNAKIAWKTKDGRTAASDAVDRLLAALSQLECERFLDNRKKEDFQQALYVVELDGVAQSYRLAIFPPLDSEEGDTREHPAISSESEEPFVLPDWRAENVMPDFGSLVTAAESAEARNSAAGKAVQ